MVHIHQHVTAFIPSILDHYDTLTTYNADKMICSTFCECVCMCVVLWLYDQHEMCSVYWIGSIFTLDAQIILYLMRQWQHAVYTIHSTNLIESIKQCILCVNHTRYSHIYTWHKHQITLANIIMGSLCSCMLIQWESICLSIVSVNIDDNGMWHTINISSLKLHRRTADMILSTS